MANTNEQSTGPAVPEGAAPPEPGLAEHGDAIDETNFRFHAQRAIKKYGDSGRLLDAILWGTIVRQYETLLARRTESRE